MKATLFILSLLVSVSLNAQTVAPGDSYDAVIETMGTPRSQIKAKNRHLLYYDRGEIELRAGRVARVAMRSAAEQASWERKRATEAARAEEEQEARRERLSVEGAALKAQMLADPNFQAAPLSYQLAFWEDFSRRYAEVPAREQLDLVRARFNAEAGEKQAAAEAARVAALQAQARDPEPEFYPLVTNNYRPRSGYWPYRPFNPGPIRYRYYDSLQPYATSPGMPLVKPTFRDESNSFSTGSGVLRLNDGGRDFIHRDRSGALPSPFSPRQP